MKNNLETKIVQKTNVLQQLILLNGLNFSSSTAAALRLAARLIEISKDHKPTDEELKLEVAFIVSDSQCG